MSVTQNCATINLMSNQKGLTGILVLVVVVITAVAGGAYYLGMQKGSTAPSPTPDETVYTKSDRSANWKTYSNSRYSFKYPADWFLSDYGDSGQHFYLSKDSADMSGPDAIFGITITDKENLVPITFKDPVGTTIGRITKTQNFTLDGKTAFRYKLEISSYDITMGTDELPGIGVYVDFGNKVLVISMSEISGDGSLILDQILSTFRFTQ